MAANRHFQLLISSSQQQQLTVPASRPKRQFTTPKGKIGTALESVCAPCSSGRSDRDIVSFLARLERYPLKEAAIRERPKRSRNANFLLVADVDLGVCF